MKKAILSLVALCVLIAFSSEKLKSAESKTNSTVSSFNLTPVTYRNLKPNAGYVEIKDVTTGQTYSAGLPPTAGSQVGNTGISLPNGDVLEVTVYSGNGNCSITCNNSTQAGVSSLYISQPFMPNPSWIVIQ